jgi:hypothetical protein
VALLEEGKLLPQQKVFRSQHRSWPQAEAQETGDIDQRRQ